MEGLGVRAYARRRGVSPNTVSIAIKAGRLVKSVTRDDLGNPKINPEMADKEWEENTDTLRHPENAPKGGGAGEGVAGATERLRAAQANLAELEYAKAAGELVLAKDVERAVTDAFTAAKTKLLAIPSRVKQAIPHLTVEEVALVERLVREALEDLAASEE